MFVFPFCHCSVTSVCLLAVRLFFLFKCFISNTKYLAADADYNGLYNNEDDDTANDDNRPTCYQCKFSLVLVQLVQLKVGFFF